MANSVTTVRRGSSWDEQWFIRNVRVGRRLCENVCGLAANRWLGSDWIGFLDFILLSTRRGVSGAVLPF